MVEEEVMAILMHIQRQLIWLDIACVCAWVGAAVNILGLGIILFRRTRRSRGGKHGVH